MATPAPVPLPGPDDVNLQPPDAEEVALLARGMASAAAPSAGLTAVQRVLIEAVFAAMTGLTINVANLEPMSPDAFARALQHRDERYRGRAVQLMVLFALVLRPLPVEVARQLAAHARALGVDEEMITVARRFAEGSLGLAAIDFQRNGYIATWHPEDAKALHVSKALDSAWDLAVADPALADRWAALEGLADGSLGRRVWELYQARGFVFRSARLRAAASGPTRLGPRPGGLRHDGRVRSRGVHPDRQSQREPACLLTAGHGGFAVRDRLPVQGSGPVRSRPRVPLVRARDGRTPR